MSDYKDLQAELQEKKDAGWKLVDGISIETVLGLLAENERLEYVVKLRNDNLTMLRDDAESNERRIKGHFKTIDSLADERDQLKAENESLRKDAERYRWLLQNWFTMSSEYKGKVTFQTGRSRWSDLPDEAVSRAIDAAMSGGD